VVTSPRPKSSDHGRSQLLGQTTFAVSVLTIAVCKSEAAPCQLHVGCSVDQDQDPAVIAPIYNHHENTTLQEGSCALGITSVWAPDRAASTEGLMDGKAEEDIWFNCSLYQVITWCSLIHTKGWKGESPEFEIQRPRFLVPILFSMALGKLLPCTGFP
jgi:hypothetical protein